MSEFPADDGADVSGTVFSGPTGLLSGVSGVAGVPGPRSAGAGVAGRCGLSSSSKSKMLLRAGGVPSARRSGATAASAAPANTTATTTRRRNVPAIMPAPFVEGVSTTRARAPHHVRFTARRIVSETPTAGQGTTGQG